MRKLREAKVFLSSSFQDMHVERDYLLTQVFPLLELVLRNYYIRLRAVDLRGTAQQCDREAFEREVFTMCLNEMDGCKPRMIGLVGNRYGWVPYRMGESDDMMTYTVKKLAAEHGLTLQDVSGKSITHLEILYGLRIMDLEKCYFFFREIENRDKLCYTDRQRYLSQDREGIETLTRELCEAYGGVEIAPETEMGSHLQRYQACVVDGVPSGLDTLGRLVYNALQSSFMESGELDGRRDPEWAIRLSNYWDDLAQDTVEHPVLQTLLRSKLPVTRVSGPEGSGKSVLLAQLLNALPEDTLAPSYVCGFEPNADNREGMLACLTRDLCFQLRRNPPETADENTFFRLLRDACAKGRHVVIVLDGLERMQDASAVADTLFYELLPQEARVVCAAGPGTFTLGAGDVQISSPCEPQLLLETMARRQGKRLDPEVMEMLMQSAARDGANPLRLSLLVRYLLTMRKEDYEAFNGFDAHLQWMRSTLESEEARTIEGCASLVVRRACAVQDASVTRAILTYLQETKRAADEAEVLEALIQRRAVPPQPAGLGAGFGRKKRWIQSLRQQMIRQQASLRPLLTFDSTSRNWSFGHAVFQTMNLRL